MEKKNRFFEASLKNNDDGNLQRHGAATQVDLAAEIRRA